MAEPSAPNGRGYVRPPADDWGPATPVYSSSTQQAAALPRGTGHGPPLGPPVVLPPDYQLGGNARELQPLPASLDPRRGSARRNRRPAYAGGDARYDAGDARFAGSAGVADPYFAGQQRSFDRSRRAEAPARGLPGWAALLLLVVIAAAGGLIDTAANIQVRGAFNIGIVVASAIAILVVRRREMLPVVLAPPIVYSGAAMLMLYIRSGGLHNRHEVLNAALNYLVYGFPAIATATGVVLVVAAVRMLARK